MKHPLQTRQALKATCALAVALSTLALPSARATTIHWGSAAGDFIYASDGVTPASNAYNFEMGTFSDGFTPTDGNIGDWASNWHVLDVASYSSVTGRLAGSVTLLNEPMPDGAILDGNATDTASFFFGKDAYVWIYNQNTTIDNTLEWTLLNNQSGGGDPASAWTFPSAIDAGAHTEVTNFALSDPGVTAGYGSERGGGTVTEGLGTSVGTPASAYGIQTFSIPDPVPEPSSGLLALAGALILACRRRRHS